MEGVGVGRIIYGRCRSRKDSIWKDNIWRV